MPKPTFRNDGIRFASYPFRASQVHPTGFIPTEEILEVDVDTAPPEIHTKKGEVIFVHATKKNKLEKWATEHRIPMNKGIDVWSLILEPFLDTSFSDESNERTFALLRDHGINRQTVTALRTQHRDAMYAYNIESGLWDWVHLGLFDLMKARSGEPFKQYRLDDDEFTQFYHEAMKIARSAWTALS